MLSTLKKHIAYTSVGHFCTDMKVSFLHNPKEKQWLIQKISLFFVVIGYAHE